MKLLALLMFCSFTLEAVTVAIASQSAQKSEAVLSAFHQQFDEVELIVQPTDSGVPAQPVGREAGIKGARNRIEQLKGQAECLVAIENYIEQNSRGEWNDCAAVLLEMNGRETLVFSAETRVPAHFVEQARLCSETVTDEGFSLTVGMAMHQSTPSIDPQDWHKEPAFGGISRKELLQDAVFKALHAEDLRFLKEKVKLYTDFPKKGVTFADYFPIIADAEAFQCCINLLYEHCKDQNIEIVVGLESRGFILGAALAARLGTGFVPVRKPGKLPGNTHSVTYEKEYGTDTLTIAEHVLQDGKRVAIIDDLIATGGSAKAAIELVRLAGGVPVEFISLLEVKELEGRSKIGIPSFNLLD